MSLFKNIELFSIFANKRILILFDFLLISLLLSGCQTSIILEPTTTFSLATEGPTLPTSTMQPTIQLGLEESPIIIGYIISGGQFNGENLSETMIIALEDKTAYEIRFEAFENPQQAFDKLRQGEVHFIFIQPLTYLAASERDLIVPLLVSNHFGLYNYGTQFLANRDSGFNIYFDEKTNKSTATADFALSQFEGKRPCWTEPSSISGTIVPHGILSKNGVSFLPPAYLQNPSATIRALYIKGICEFGATYSYSGDPRTSSQVINDLPDVMDRILIIWQSDAIIPSLGLSAAVTVPPQVQSDIKNAFLNLIADENGKSIISDALQYDIQGFLSIEDDYYDALRELVKAANINPYQHLGN
jgi:phosphonate transport system substrate-binding protein